MYPKLFEIGSVAVHSYGFLIMIGAFLGYLYMRTTAQKEMGIEGEKIQTLAILIIFGAFVGGKIFFYFEAPSYYFSPPSNMLKNFRTGFVFYGSLLTALPMAIWYFRKQKWPLWPMMDILAITATIIHFFGRLGCFFAGCCYGVEADVPWVVTFTHEHTKAKPVGEPLHPTQLYSAFLIGSIFLVLWMFKRHKRFEGQLFFIYLILYATGRGVIEIFRGDLRRGFVIGEWLSHSQFISIIIISTAAWMYYRFSKKASFKKN